ncbi:protein disulfide isomerase, putative [Entamoeba invadens IP1]|uniref:Protein disulfide isomerase, putative n=1 Tax=Entamoeba invadens IP1 TaxID=370355 RepID=A0A0A1U8J4_ENTIV|nr:protein disulfide isomerase, putative [Entamoeba invadens IP1]ELP89393.1 protein disulfide isomerase, putative [Entamoeba invadens IP1]|eukprot:XP_004256164.1 protein disulfide isomerase, putative [Entamoeba invadens IP1]
MTVVMLLVLLAIVSASKYDTSPKRLKRAQADGGKFFVRYYAPWCGYCQEMSHDFKKLAKELQSSSVTVCQIDCERYPDYCEKAGVDGFPTMKMYNGNDLLSDYNGERKYESMKAFLNDYLQ